MVYQYLIKERKSYIIPAGRSPSIEEKIRARRGRKEKKKRARRLPIYKKRADLGLPIFPDEPDDKPIA